MSPAVVTALVTGLVTLVACPAVIALLRRTGRVDTPNARSSHTVPTPRGGGLGVAAGVVGAGVAAVLTGHPWTGGTLAAVATVAALSAVGLVDDLRGLDPAPRLLAQITAGALAGVALGGPAGAAVGAVVVPATVNMVNFMDGIDGICAGHAALWGVGASVAASLAGRGGLEPLATLGALSLGGAVGFLPYNAPRARLFLGDVGSYLLGGLAGVGVLVGLLAVPRPEVDAWPLVGLLCAPYLLFAVDTAVTIVRRGRAGEPVFEAHRSHVYQRLANERGVAHWMVSAAMVAAALVVMLACLVSWVLGVALAVAVAAAYLRAPGQLHREVAA